MRANDVRQHDPTSGYLAYHAPRYLRLLDTLAPLLRPSSVVLDIGRSTLTELIAERFKVRVDTLGFHADTQHATGRHFEFDLNDAANPGAWRADVGTYDVIVLAEVIEHLYTAPSHVLRFITSRLEPGGALVVQTPNAVALHKRLKMLVGLNPSELIRADRLDPGHFREYTARELAKLATDAGLRVESCEAHSYFDYRFRNHRRAPVEALGALNLLYGLVPAGLKPGLTLVARSPLRPPELDGQGAAAGGL